MTRRSSLIAILACCVTASAFVVQRPHHPAMSSLSAATMDAPPTSSTKEEDSTPPPLAPLTEWGRPIDDIRAVQAAARESSMPEFAVTVDAHDVLRDPSDIQEQMSYFQNNAWDIKSRMELHAAVIFRNFTLMQSQEGFQDFYKALGMNVCLDPLHSVSARPTVDGKKNSPVYEAVNKESRKNFFIGMHNEFVGTRAPQAAAFCCFQAAPVGGEFLIADGRRVFADLDPDLVQELYRRQIRYSVMELPFFGWMDNLPAFAQDVAMNVVRALASAAINAKVDFDVDLQWQQGGEYDDGKLLQARAPSQPPIVLHPTTGEPTWFCNVHSHSSKLRKAREEIYGAERFEDGASRINKSDMFFGDDGDLSPQALRHMDEITMKHTKYVKMQKGDVVLLDNYKCMHGRNVFDGKRKHGVAWFEGWQGQEQMKQAVEKSLKKEDNDDGLFFVKEK